MAPRKPDRLHLLGIRHHGPGSARAVLAALDAADPAIVLIEGPPDAGDMIPFAASPQRQAMRWALAKGRPVRFIDLPMSIRLAERMMPLTLPPGAGGAPGAPVG